jgi:DNA repair photolyase
MMRENVKFVRKWLRNLENRRKVVTLGVGKKMDFRYGGEDGPTPWTASDREAPYLSGRGAQINTPNPYQAKQYTEVYHEGLDEPLLRNENTVFLHENAKHIVNEVKSPDIPLPYSLNPYQGCEHGCVYCYARNTHEYWGYSAGLDFERRIIVKDNAAQLLENTFKSKSWKPAPIMLSGNTDCYQPIERQLKITRSLLEIFWAYRHPVGIITKNALILRDLDLLQKLASENLVHVSISITSADDRLRRLLEPRGSSISQRLKTIGALASAGIPTHAMIAPVIPSLNSQDVPELMRVCSEAGASSLSYSMVRLNGAVAEIFKDWLHKNFPDRASKVLDAISQFHGGKLSDSRPGIRMRGEGTMAESFQKLYRMAFQKYFAGRSMPEYNLSAFCIPSQPKQLSLF